MVVGGLWFEGSLFWGCGCWLSGWVDVGTFTEFESGLVEWEASVESPEVELIALGAAAEALKEVAL